MSGELSIEDKKQLLKIARQTITGFLENGNRDYPVLDNPLFSENRGVFVTLHLNGDLRGCIGYPTPIKPLLEAVVDNAINSSTEDYRFNTVTLAEMKEIDIEITVLTVPKKVNSVEDVEVGRDGIIIRKGFQSGLLLPQVPVEQGWNLEEYISYGCIKAGLPKDQWKHGVEIETFQGDVFGELQFTETQ